MITPAFHHWLPTETLGAAPDEADQPRRVLFDHMPKCAGTTIVQYLAKHYSPEVHWQANGDVPLDSCGQFQLLPEEQRFHYPLLTGHSIRSVIPHVHPDTIRVTSLREPVDRIISHYYFVLRDSANYLHERVTKENISLEEYVRMGISPELRNWYTTYFTGLSIKEAERRPWAAVWQAFNTIMSEFHIVGFQDDIPGLVREMQEHCRLHIPYENEFVNRTEQRPTVEEVSPEVKRSIRETNILDVRLFHLLKSHARSPVVGSFDRVYRWLQAG